MSTTTTNFGWTVPSDTDLVKDGAAAIRTALGGVDTSFVDLKGGTSGQMLTKASGTDLDFTWVTPEIGDITAVVAGTGLSGGGTTGSVTLSIDSTVTTLTGTQTLTNKTLTSPVLTTPSISTIDAKGDLLVGTADATIDRLAVGTNGQVLTADSTTATGLKWATAASGSAFTKIAKTTFSGATAASFNDVFSSTYSNYRIMVKIDSTSGNNQPVYFKLRVSGSDATTNYKAATLYNAGTDTAYAYRNVAGDGNFYLPECDDTYSNQWYAVIDVMVPNVAQYTGFFATTYATTYQNNANIVNTNGVHQSNTQYTGFSLVSATGNIAGTAWIYGYGD